MQGSLSLVVVRSHGATVMVSWRVRVLARLAPGGPSRGGRAHSEYAGPSSGPCRGFRIRVGGLASELDPEVRAQGSGGPW